MSDSNDFLEIDDSDDENAIDHANDGKTTENDKTERGDNANERQELEITQWPQRSISSQHSPSRFAAFARGDGPTTSYDSDLDENSDGLKMILKKLKITETDDGFSLDNTSTFDEIVVQLEQELLNRAVRQNLVNRLKRAWKRRTVFEKYLVPMTSDNGVQECLFRALLLCKWICSDCMDSLMQYLDELASSHDAQQHQKGQSYAYLLCSITGKIETNAAISAIFGRDIHKWAPLIRDTLIEILPQILTDFASHSELVLPLKDLSLRQPSADSASFRKTIFMILRALRCGNTVLKETRQQLCESVMTIDPEALPDLLEYVVFSIKLDTLSKMRDILWDLKTNIEIEKLNRPRNRRSIDSILRGMFSPIIEFIANDQDKHWEEFEVFFKSSDAKSCRIGARGSGRAFDSFDVILCLFMLEKDLKAPNVKAFLRKCLTLQSNMDDIILSVLEFVKIDLHVLLDLARDFITSPDSSIIATSLYAWLLAHDKIEHRTQVAETAIRYACHSSTASPILTAFENVLADGGDVLLPYLVKFFDSYHEWKKLNTESLTRLFGVMISLYTKEIELGEKKTSICFDQMMMALSTCSDDADRLVAVVGLIVRLKTALLQGRHGQSTGRQIFEKLTELADKSIPLKAFYYEHMAAVFRSCKKIAESVLIDELYQSLSGEFKKFFSSNDDRNIGTIDEEFQNPEYVESSVKCWFCPEATVLATVVPLFELIKELFNLRLSWNRGDRSNQHLEIEFLDEFSYVLESNISYHYLKNKCDSPNQEEKMIFYVIDWIRTVLNSFWNNGAAVQSSNTKSDSFLEKKLGLLVALQRKLMMDLDDEPSWNVPVSLRVRFPVIIVSDKQEPKKKVVVGRKRRAPATTEENPGATQSPGSQVATTQALPAKTQPLAVPDNGSSPRVKRKSMVKSGRTINLDNFPDYLRPLNLDAVCYLLKCLSAHPISKSNDRAVEILKTKIFLLSELSKRLDSVASSEKKGLFRGFKSRSAHLDIFPSSEYSLENPSIIWTKIVEATPYIWTMLNSIVLYLKDEDDMSHGSIEPRKFMKLSLDVFSKIVNSVVISPKDRNVDDEGVEMRDKFFTLISQAHESAGISCSQSENDDESPEAKVISYFLEHVGPVLPCIEATVPLIDIVSNSRKISSGKLKGLCIFHMVKFLQREWTDDEGRALKGAAISQPVRFILTRLLKTLPQKRVFGFMQYLLANKVGKLVTDIKERKSIAEQFEMESPPGLASEEFLQEFANISVQTFTTIYKVLFASLVGNVQEWLQMAEEWKESEDRVKKVLLQWTQAANVFCLLGLFLRVKQFRNINVLMTAAKEGKNFLTLFHKNCSFLQILMKHGSSRVFASDINSIIRSIQVGNRNMQNIGTHAKKMRSAGLLKLLPELRSVSEQWMRSIREALANTGHSDAIIIGHLKSRDLDGVEITENTGQTEDSEDSDDDDDENSATNDDQDTREQSGDGEREISPGF